MKDAHTKTIAAPQQRDKADAGWRALGQTWGIWLVLLLAVLLDPATMTERRAWLIPMNRLESVCRRGKSNLIMRPSIQMDSKDRYTQFRCADLSQVADRIIAQIDR